ncbi:MAG: TerC family protein [Chloroflexi bacterium]|nr:TerC family protein [Chloroflexota bacterium]MDA1220229.1 TerC family protein [Chloroflexota bacterium]
MYFPDNTLLLWVAFGVIVLVMLSIDLGVFHRRAHVVQVKEAAIWSVTWIGLSLLFNLGVFLWLGNEKGLEFLTSYLIEKSLSLDNIFIWVVIFSDFALPDRYQHRVLFYGILGALILRGVFIAMGVTLLNSFHWVVYIFGAFLIFTALRLLLHRNRAVLLDRNPVVLIVRRFFPITSGYNGQSFLVVENGRRMVTPLLLVLLVVESTDIVFALDSVPAVLAVTRDPFIVYTSNVFAILGLRALFFLLTDVLHRVRYLKVGLALLLSFVGAKMLLSNFYEFPILLSLGVILGILVATVLASYLKYLQEAKIGQQSAGG